MMKQKESLTEILKQAADKCQEKVDPTAILEVCAIALFLKQASLLSTDGTGSICVLPDTSDPVGLAEAGLQLSPGKFRDRVRDALDALETANPDVIPAETFTGAFRENRYLDAELIKTVLTAVRDVDFPCGSPEKVTQVLGEVADHVSGFLPGGKQDIDSPRGLDRLVAGLAALNCHWQETGPLGICDPVCGTGGFLAECAGMFGVERSSVFGMELNMAACRLARIHMLMLGLNPSRILNCDTLLNPGLVSDGELQTFDIVVAAVPTAGRLPYDAYHAEDPYKRYDLGTPGRPEYLFLGHIEKSLKPLSGRAVTLLPPNALFVGDTGHDSLFETVELKMRQDLVNRNILDAVILLPRNLMFTGASPIAVLILDRAREEDGRRADQTDVMFVDAGGESFFQHGKRRHVLLPTHIERIVGLVRDRKDVPGIARAADTKEIMNFRYDLSVARYVENPVETMNIDALRTDLCRIAEELAVVRGQIDSVLNRLAHCEKGSIEEVSGQSEGKEKHG